MASEALRVRIAVKEASYPIYLETGVLSRVGELLIRYLPDLRKILLVSDTEVFPLYGQRVVETLTRAGFSVETATVPVGEESKSLTQAEILYRAALDFGLSRRDIVLALGGGVVGDLAGFVAATYMRGVRFVQIPTTLLAQVDSSVGGKVGVNFQDLKNAVGAFYQPNLVVMDPETLQTLPLREWRAGLAEVVKYALIENSCDPLAAPQALFKRLQAEASRLRAPDGASSSALHEIIRRCCALKAWVVAADERESTGMRALLNLGHTFAHAYEEITAYRQWKHGEAVAMGLIQACRLSNRLGLLPEAETQRVEALFDALELSKQPDIELDLVRLLALMRHDKKAQDGAIRFVLPVESVGHIALRANVPDADVLAVLNLPV